MQAAQLSNHAAHDAKRCKVQASKSEKLWFYLSLVEKFTGGLLTNYRMKQCKRALISKLN